MFNEIFRSFFCQKLWENIANIAWNETDQYQLSLNGGKFWTVNSVQQKQNTTNQVEFFREIIARNLTSRNALITSKVCYILFQIIGLAFFEAK